jgi:glycosyltransferase involved in cell wall biosynthesis
MTVWIDVEDLVRYFHYAARPTGIQRLSFEIYRELSRHDGEAEIRFCRRGATPSGFRSLHFPALEAGILTAAASGPRAAPAASAPPPASRLQDAARALPPRYRQPLGEIFRGLHQSLAGLRGLARAASGEISGTAKRGVQIGRHQFDLGGEDVTFAAGDWFINLGASWDMPYDPAFLAQLRAGQVRFGLMVYDLIPELFPEWALRGTDGAYRAWLRDTVPAADAVFTISDCTASDLRRCLTAAGKNVPTPVVLPVGSIAPVDTLDLPSPIPNQYVLLVSTMEIRKNHLLMFRVWRQLLETMPAEQVPDLVFAGKVGWLTEDFRQQLNNCNWLNGKIKFLASPSEPELAALYRHCLFTVFPSFYEGWGLPVSESLTFGKTVAASNRSSIPEAGGSFCAYFNPDNLDDAYGTIAKLILVPAAREKLETHIANNFNPPTWQDTATALLQILAPASPRHPVGWVSGRDFAGA